MSKPSIFNTPKMLAAPVFQPSQIQDLQGEEICRLAQVCGSVLLQSKTNPNRSVSCDVIQFLQKLLPMLQLHNVRVKNFFLVGGAASHVACPSYDYSDIDITFDLQIDERGRTPCVVECEEIRVFQEIETVIEALLHEFVCLTGGGSLELAKSFIAKKFKFDKNTPTPFPTNDLWSIFSFYNSGGRNLELKFVARMARQYEMPTDSIKIDLAKGYYFPKMSSYYPNLGKALELLKNKRILTEEPEKIIGGGLLKCTSLLLKDFTEEMTGVAYDNAMYARVNGFLTYCKANASRQPVRSYLASHFGPSETVKKQDFLLLLRSSLRFVKEEKDFNDFDRVIDGLAREIGMPLPKRTFEFKDRTSSSSQ